MVDTSGSSYCSDCSTSDDETSSVGSTSADNGVKRQANVAYRNTNRKKAIRRHADPDCDKVDDIYMNVYNSNDVDTMVADDDDDDDQKIPSTSPSSTHFVLGPYDVICGRNKAAFNNVGNRRFRFTISLVLPRFLNAKSRKDKSIVIESIKQLVHQNGGKFLIMENGGDVPVGTTTTNDSLENNDNVVWTQLDSKQSHLKVGHALRDAERKLSKSRKQQQKQMRQQQEQHRQQQEQQQSVVPLPDQKAPAGFTPSVLENKSLMDLNNYRYTDPLLRNHHLDYSVSWDMDGYDVASISTHFYNNDIDGDDTHSLMSPKPLSQQSIPFQPSDPIPTVSEHNHLPVLQPQSLQQNYFPNLHRHRQLQRFIEATPPQQQHHRSIPPPTFAFNNLNHLQNTGRQQLSQVQQQQQQRIYNNNNSIVTMNGISLPIPSWSHNRLLTGSNSMQQSTQQQIMIPRGDQMIFHNEDHRRQTTPITWDNRDIVTEHQYPQFQHTQLRGNNYTDDDNHHRHIMSWLVDESDDVIDDCIISLGI